MELGYIYQVCKPCGGTGERSVSGIAGDEEIRETVECSTCGGSGRRPVAGLSDDLIDLFNDMNDKINDIFEKVK